MGNARDSKQLLKLAAFKFLPHLFPSLLILSACVHTPIPPEQQAAYSTCAGVLIEQAANNLAGAGYPISAKSESYVQTDWFGEITSNSLQVRVSVSNAENGIVFRVWKRIASNLGFMVFGDTVEWKITKQDLKRKADKAHLNKIRSDVCGTAAYFE